MTKIVKGNIAIIHQKTPKGILFLIVKNIPSGNITFAGGAKGDNETDEIAIRRELQEELNFSSTEKQIQKTNLKISFTFNQAKKERAGMRAHYNVFTIQVDSSSIQPNPNEISEYWWLPKEEAKRRLTFPEEGAVLDNLF